MPRPLDQEAPSSDVGLGASPTAPIDALADVMRLAEGGHDRDGYVPLDRNERLGPLPAPVVEEIRAGVDSALLTGYPILDDLYEDLVRILCIDRHGLLLTPGSDAAFRSLYQAYIRPGDRIVMLDPSYAMYPIYATMFGARSVRVPFGGDLSLDGGALLDAITEQVRLVMLANPNQPTGTRLEIGLLEAVVERADGAGALVVIDEAYFPFSRETVLRWLADRPHLVITRTFSKAWGLAGARVGFVAAHPQVIASLYKVRSAYDVNALAALSARTLLKHPEVAEAYVEEVRAGRALVSERVRAVGLEVLPGETNFQLIRVGDRIEPAMLIERLRERGYLVKGPFTAPCLRDCVRITLGPPALMAAFCDVLEEVLGGG
jgi:histidinol-phosphate aminotransferase